MIHLEGLLPFRRPVIVGTELVSLSALLTCRGAGIRPVADDRGQRPAHRGPARVALFPRLLGIPVHLRRRDRRDPRAGAASRSCAGARSRRQARRTRLRRRAVHAAASCPRPRWCAAATSSSMPAVAAQSIDQFGRCSDPSYFAAGNLLRPVETAGWSFREGSRIAGCIADDLAGRLPRIERDPAHRARPRRQAGGAPAPGACHWAAGLATVAGAGRPGDQGELDLTLPTAFRSGTAGASRCRSGACWSRCRLSSPTPPAGWRSASQAGQEGTPHAQCHGRTTVRLLGIAPCLAGLAQLTQVHNNNAEELK